MTPLQLALASVAQPGVPSSAGPAKGDGSSFVQALGQALEKVDAAQKNADQVTADFAAGKVQDVHTVVMALNEADLSLRLALEVRNKVVEAWQDISRIQA